MPKAYWNGATIADSGDTIVVEDVHYFPPESVRRDLLQESSTQATCPRKGVASYYHVVVDGDLNADAAWTYRDPKPVAREIKNYIAFWHGVEVE